MAQQNSGLFDPNLKSDIRIDLEDNYIIDKLKHEISTSWANKLWGNLPNILVFDNKTEELNEEATKRLYEILSDSNFKELIWNIEYNLSNTGREGVMVDIDSGQPVLTSGNISINPTMKYGRVLGVGIIKEHIQLHGAKIRLFEYYIADEFKINNARVERQATKAETDDKGKEKEQLKISLKEFGEAKNLSMATANVLTRELGRQFEYPIKTLPFWEFKNKPDRASDFLKLEKVFQTIEQAWTAMVNEIKINKTRLLFLRDGAPMNGIEKLKVEEEALLQQSAMVVSAVENEMGRLPWEIVLGNPQIELYLQHIQSLIDIVLKATGTTDSIESNGVHNKTKVEAMTNGRNQEILITKRSQRQEDLKRMFRIIIDIENKINPNSVFPKDYDLFVELLTTDTQDPKERDDILRSELEMGVRSKAEIISIKYQIPMLEALKLRRAKDVVRMEEWRADGKLFEGYKNGISERIALPEDRQAVLMAQEESQKEDGGSVGKSSSKTVSATKTGSGAKQKRSGGGSGASESMSNIASNAKFR